MLSYELYKVIHILGIALIVTALGGVALHALNGGLKRDNRARALVAALHGTGMLLVIVAGFGRFARRELPQSAMLSGWLITKLVVWILLGAAIALPYRRPTLARLMLVAVPLLAGLAAYMAICKPV